MNMKFNPLGHDTPKHDRDVLVNLSFKYSSIVEVGCWAGQTTLTLAKAGVSRIYAVDHWKGSKGDHLRATVEELGEDMVFRTFCRNLKEYLFATVIPCRGPSLLWASVWPFEVDMVFIDGDHSYEAVLADICAWSKHIRKGGILCGHDWIFGGVQKAVIETYPERYRTEANVWIVEL